MKFKYFKIGYSYIDVRDGVIHSTMSVVSSSPDEAVKYVRELYLPIESFHLESVEVIE